MVTTGREGRTRWGHYWRNPNFAVGAILVVGIVASAVLADAIAPFSPLTIRPQEAFAGPSRLHPFGTDEFGRDLLSRVLFGARTSLGASLVAVGLALGAGSICGMVFAYVGGWVDLLMMRLMDIIWGFPAILLALVIMALLTPNLINAMLAIAVIFVPVFARVARATTLVELRKEYMEAARAVGCPGWWLIVRHILPNVSPPILVQGTNIIAYAITMEAALSFLGLGAQPPTPSWGSMLAGGRELLSNTPWVALTSGAAISLTILGFSLLGDGLRETMDPTLWI